MPKSMSTIQGYAGEELTNLSRVDFTKCTSLPSLGHNAFTNIRKDCQILVPVDLYSECLLDENWMLYEEHLVPYAEHTLVKENNRESNMIEYNTTLDFDFTAIKFGSDMSTATVDVTFANNLMSVTNITKEASSELLGNIRVTIGDLGLEGDEVVTITITSGDYVYTKSYTVKIYAELPTKWTVESVGATYGFKLNNNGYYESENKGIPSSYAICKVNIENSIGANVFIDCINFAESKYDYGLLSTLNTTLSSSTSADSSSSLQKSFKGLQSATVQTVEYGAVEGYIYIKFIKDYSGDSNNDTLQFRVRFE
jgi:hypothetical protein